MSGSRNVSLVTVGFRQKFGNHLHGVTTRRRQSTIFIQFHHETWSQSTTSTRRAKTSVAVEATKFDSVSHSARDYLRMLKPTFVPSLQSASHDVDDPTN
jgi:hypothetical protein